MSIPGAAFRRALHHLALGTLALGLCGAAASPGWAEGVTDDAAALGRDAATYAGAPVAWGADQWRTFALTAGAVGATMLADRPVREAFEDIRTSTTSRLSKAVRGLGEPLGIGGVLVAGTYLGGWAAGRSRWRETGFEMAEAALFSGAAAGVLKVAVGRSRPEEDEGSTSFHLFAGGANGRQSFPSGHTTFAFALAAVASERVPGLGWAAYPLAGLVGLSRIHDDQHWASDVVAGAALGTATGWWVVKQGRNREERGGVSLALLDGGLGLTWARAF